MPQAGRLTKQKFIVSSSGGQSSETKVPTGLAPSEAEEEPAAVLCPGLADARLHVHRALSLCVSLSPNFPFL